jgi:hypothetical protein
MPQQAASAWRLHASTRRKNWSLNQKAYKDGDLALIEQYRSVAKSFELRLDAVIAFIFDPVFTTSRQIGQTSTGRQKCRPAD